MELTNNQFDPVAVLDETEEAMGLPSVLVTARFWNEDAPDPAVDVKVATLGLNTSSAVLLTTSVTWIVCGLLLGPVGVSEIVPV